MRVKRMVEFRATDALAFADAFRFGRRMDPSDLDAKIQAERTSGAMGPAALRGLEFARAEPSGAIPAVVRFEVGCDVDEPA